MKHRAAKVDVNYNNWVVKDSFPLLYKEAPSRHSSAFGARVVPEAAMVAYRITGSDHDGLQIFVIITELVVINTKQIYHLSRSLTTV